MCKYCRQGTFEELTVERMTRSDGPSTCEELVDYPRPDDFGPCGEPAACRLLAKNTDEHLCADHKHAFVREYLQDQIDDAHEVASFEEGSLRRIGPGEPCNGFGASGCRKAATWVSIVTWEIRRCHRHKDAPPPNSSAARAADA